jgi:excisionase family DNA binding protein
MEAWSYFCATTPQADVLPFVAYPVNEAAKLIGLGRTKLYEAISDGSLRAVKLGRRTLVPADALQQFVDALPVVRAA